MMSLVTRLGTLPITVRTFQDHLVGRTRVLPEQARCPGILHADFLFFLDLNSVRCPPQLLSHLKSPRICLE
jgi:hypothetical protein